jgi:hypothetical protein
MIWLAITAGIYVLLALLVFVMQDQMLFPGAGRGERPLGDQRGLRMFELERDGGERFRAVETATDAPRAVMLFFVGNGEDLCSAAGWCMELRDYGLHAISIEYPGYGASPGRPGLDSIYASARAAARHAHAAAQRLGVPLYAGGSSLGTFAATLVAGEFPVEKLLLRAPPTSIAAVAAGHYWWLPVGLLLRHRFDNVANAAKVRCPVLIVHGADDDIVPAAHGRALRAAFAGGAELVEVPGHGHNDLSLDRLGPAGAAVGKFLGGG